MDLQACYWPIVSKFKKIYFIFLVWGQCGVKIRGKGLFLANSFEIQKQNLYFISLVWGQ